MKKRTVITYIIIVAAFLFNASAYALTGDIDSSGTVDGADLAIISTSFGLDSTSPSWKRQVDIINSGLIDGDDLSLLAANFGIGVGVGSVAAKVVWGGRSMSKAVSGGLSKPSFKAPLSVATVRVEVAGPGMATITSDFDASSGSGSINGVPSGNNRTVTITGIDAGGVTQYTGSETVSVLKGQTTTVDIFLSAVTSVVDSPTDFLANAIPGGISFSWTLSAGAVGYRLYYGVVSHDYTDHIDLGNTASYVITGLIPGTYYVALTAIDATGQESWYADYSNEISVDVVSDPDDPSGTIIINSDVLSVNSTSIIAYITAADNSVVTDYYLTNDSAFTPISSDWVPVTPFSNFSASVPFTLSSGDGTKTTYLWVKDGSSNQLVVASDDIILDTASPSSASISINNGLFTNTTAISLSLIANDTVGVVGYYLSESSTVPAPLDAGWVTVASTTNYSDTAVNFMLTAGDAMKTVYAWFKDGAGNISAFTSDDVRLDTDPPSSASISINSGLFTNTTAISLSLIANDTVGVVGYYLSESSTVPAPLDAGWVTVASTTNYSDTAVNFMLTAGDAMKTVYAWFKDGAGNISAFTSDDVRLDTDPPSSASISINSGLFTNTTAISLSLIANDTVGIVGYYLSESSTVPAPLDAGWVTVASTTNYSDTAVNFMLTAGDAMKTVYAWFKDGAGNISAFTSDDVRLDTDPPSSASISINSGLFTNTTAISLSLIANDTVGVVGYYLSESSTVPAPLDAGWVTVASTTNYSDTAVNFMLTAGDAMKTVYAWFKDGAGNVSVLTSDSVTLDTVSPASVTALSVTSGIGKMILAWTNPVIDFDYVVIRQDTTSQPLTPSDGSEIYNNISTSYEDFNLDPSLLHYYTLFAYDASGNYSAAANVSGTPLSATPSLAGGYGHSLALTANGSVLGWGLNDLGQIGDGTIVNKQNPVNISQVNNFRGVASIDAESDHSIAVRGDGKVWTWGDNDCGQIGNNTAGDCIFGNATTAYETAPVELLKDLNNDSFENITAVQAGAYFNAVLKNDSTVWTWGDNFFAQLGDGTEDDRKAPVQAAVDISIKLRGVAAISAGGLHTLALKSNGTVWAWGHNGSGQIGDGSQVDSIYATQVKDSAGTGFLTDIVAVTAGAYHSVALANNSTVWAWGDKDFGQIGNATFGNQSSDTVFGDYTTTPVQVVDTAGTGTLTGIKAIAAGDYYTLALANDGTLYAWGLNDYGQLSQDPVPLPFSATPVVVPLAGVESIHSGDDHVLIMMADGTVWTWGDDEFGQLGDGVPGDGDIATKEFSFVPTQIPGLDLKNYPYYP